jgi:GAF domain-containing protein
LQLMASSSEASRLLELFQLQSDEGPCLDCFHTGKQVAVADLDAVSDRWPRFAVAAREQGYGAVHATPLRLRQEVIGALNLFNSAPRALSQDDLDVAQALADVATIAILQERATHHGEIVVEQLQGALNTRVIIEQAKGLLAGASNLDMDQAFWRLRYAARNTNRRLADVAQDLIEGRLDPSSIIAARPANALDDHTKPQLV